MADTGGLVETKSFRPKGVRLTDTPWDARQRQRGGRVREVLVSRLSSSNWLQTKAKGERKKKKKKIGGEARAGE